VTDQSSVSLTDIQPNKLNEGEGIRGSEPHGSIEGTIQIPVGENLPLEKPENNLAITRKTNWPKQQLTKFKNYYSDWLTLQQDVRTFPNRAREQMKVILQNFALYRLTLTGLTYKAPRIEDEIWVKYNRILASIPHLERMNQKRPLFLNTKAQLQELKQAWVDLQTQQNALYALLKKAPKGLEFYNRMQIVREKKRQEELRQQAHKAQIEVAYESVKKALSYVEFQCKDDEPIFFGNAVITLQDAQHLWNENLSEILTMRDLKTVSIDTILERIHSLEEMVRDYPSISKQIQRVGERFSRLIAYHDLLSSYGKRIIPQAEIARASAIMYEQIPAFWSAGQYPNLRIFLERVENFLNFYENTVELEVAIGERRRSGFTQGLSPSIIPGVSGLSPLIGMARVMIAAIDQRDRFMVGHSESVAKLVLQTGRKLNWAESDLEFLEIAALLHDIGKISIPETILTKIKPLTSQEWKMIQMHPYYGAQIVKQMSVFNRIVPWIYHHQEHWDGSGYPEQLSKKDIPNASSLISIAEAYSVMTSDLPYRTSVTTREALDKIQDAAGKQFDPGVVEAFVEGLTETEKINRERQ